MEIPESHIYSYDRQSLSLSVWFCYGVGHVLNDICASLWFTYLLVFFHLVLKFDAVSAGIILLVGQVADAISTPFVGIESDRNSNSLMFKYGKRKIWHLIGTVCILLSFPFIFTPCIGCRNAHISAQMIYYIPFVVIFQFGWAAVQISHLALIPELTPNDNQRIQLTSIRYCFTVISTILIYVVTWISLKSGEKNDDSTQIGSNNAFSFQIVVYIGLLIGLITSFIFHWGVKENSMWKHKMQRNDHKTIFQFIQEWKFYQVALCYTSSRLFINIAQVYIPLYLHETLVKNSENLAIIPLIMYMGSIATSGVVDKINRILGRKVAYGIGSLIGILACLWINYGQHSEYEIYPISVLLGVGGSILVVTGLSLTADLIGFDTDTGAFVYGAMSFFDKLSNGIVVIVIQYLKNSASPKFYQNVLVFVCGGAALTGLLSIYTFKTSIRKNHESDAEESKPLVRS